MAGWKDLFDKARKTVRNAEQIHLEQAVARVKSELCTGCKVCVPIGHCYAIEMVDATDGVKHPRNKNNLVAKVDPYNCTGCHTCFDLCPTNCFIWAGVPEDRDYIPV